RSVSIAYAYIITLIIFYIKFCGTVLLIVKLTCKIIVKSNQVNKYGKGKVVFMEMTFIYIDAPNIDLKNFSLDDFYT
ncbi:hypothetical protein, partial [Enterococcus faecalis]|uniref:hypothetical protein n=1 Tax=Enterococcus faecalis TaxID=1351 RepID=UPI003D6A5386